MVSDEASPEASSETAAERVDGKTAAVRCARIMAEKKADNILVLEVKDLILITHYFVICSASNRRQVQSIADEMQAQMKTLGLRCMGQEGYRQAGWVLLDYQDLICHVFLDEMRQYYDLELHWGDAPRLDWETA